MASGTPPARSPQGTTERYTQDDEIARVEWVVGRETSAIARTPPAPGPAIATAAGPKGSVRVMNAVVSPSQGLCSEEIVLQRLIGHPSLSLASAEPCPTLGIGEGRMSVCTAPVRSHENRAPKQCRSSVCEHGS